MSKIAKIDFFVGFLPGNSKSAHFWKKWNVFAVFEKVKKRNFAKCESRGWENAILHSENAKKCKKCKKVKKVKFWEFFGKNGSENSKNGDLRFKQL